MTEKEKNDAVAAFREMNAASDALMHLTLLATPEELVDVAVRSKVVLRDIEERLRAVRRAYSSMGPLKVTRDVRR